MKTAVIKTGGRQYIVHEGDVLKMDKLSDKEGAKVAFNEVLLASTDKTVQMGYPLVDKAKVEAEVVSHGRHEKVTGVKMKAKKRYRRYFGHKQHFTAIKITKITVK